MSKKMAVPGFSLNGFIVPGNDGDWYKKVLYADAKSIIKEKMMSSAENFVAIGYYLKQIWENEQYREDGYSSIWECAASEFHLSQSAASRYVNICKRFSKDGDSPFLDEEYKNFNRGQLQEMLSIKDENSLKEITPDMTAREIRQKRTKKSPIKLSETSEETLKNSETEVIDGQMTIEGDFRNFIPVSQDKLTEQDCDRSDNEEIRMSKFKEKVKEKVTTVYAELIELSYAERLEKGWVIEEFIKNFTELNSKI